MYIIQNYIGIICLFYDYNIKKLKFDMNKNYFLLKQYENKYENNIISRYSSHIVQS